MDTKDPTVKGVSSHHPIIQETRERLCGRLLMPPSNFVNQTLPLKFRMPFNELGTAKLQQGAPNSDVLQFIPPSIANLVSIVFEATFIYR